MSQCIILFQKTMNAHVQQLALEITKHFQVNIDTLEKSEHSLKNAYTALHILQYLKTCPTKRIINATEPIYVIFDTSIDPHILTFIEQYSCSFFVSIDAYICCGARTCPNLWQNIQKETELLKEKMMYWYVDSTSSNTTFTTMLNKTTSTLSLTPLFTNTAWFYQINKT